MRARNSDRLCRPSRGRYRAEWRNHWQSVFVATAAHESKLLMKAATCPIGTKGQLITCIELACGDGSAAPPHTVCKGTNVMMKWGLGGMLPAALRWSASENGWNNTKVQLE